MRASGGLAQLLMDDPPGVLESRRGIQVCGRFSLL